MDRDLKDIARVRHRGAMRELINTLAAWSSKYIDISAIGAGLSIRRPTVESYLNALEAMYIWDEKQVFLDADRSGKLAETFVFNELAAQSDLGDYELYHYRDRQKREIDFLLERGDGALLGVEVKAGSAVGRDDFKHLRWFKANLAKNRSFVGIVLYTGNRALSFGDGLWALPISMLWA